MPPTADADEPRPLRADARDNRERLLDAARDLFIEYGPRASLDEIARRAGIGIATLYRRFPQRQALMHAVVLDALLRTAAEARQAADEEPDPFGALVRYMHRVIAVRTAAVIPALLGEISLDDEEIMRAREAVSAPVEALVEAAHRAGTLRPGHLRRHRHAHRAHVPPAGRRLLPGDQHRPQPSPPGPGH